MRQDRDVREVLGRRAQQRDAADVDLLDRFVQRHAVAGDGRLERIEVHDDRVDRRNRVRFHLLFVHGVPALVKNRAEDFRMERFNPAVEQSRKAG